MKRVAVFGGGMAGLTAALALSDPAAGRGACRVDVYQMGFRLGGKGASGCNPWRGERIEEHGLHVWMGFYENAFRVLRGVYDELGRPASHPLATFEQAFAPQDLVGWCERIGAEWRPWLAPFARRPGAPGDGDARFPTPAALAAQLAPRFLSTWYHIRGATGGFHPIESPAKELWGWYQQVSLRGAELAQGLAPMTDLRARVLERLEPHLAGDDEARRIWIGMDFLYALTRGLVADRITSRGFDVVEHLDLRAWLSRHGATPHTLDSALVRSLYDFVFAYEGGDPERPRLSAATMLRVALRMLFGYRGAIFWRMTAGMGETVFSPIYEVLRRRGVGIHFFHRLEHLEVRGRRLASARLALQARPRGAYEPLRPVKGREVWGVAPRLDQLEDGGRLAELGVDLESGRAAPGEGHRVLERGRDFDEAILAVPATALHASCPGLLRESDALASAAGLGSVATQALQLWMTRTPGEAGWPGGPSIVTGFAPPYSSWADFSDLLAREDWPAAGPRSLAYLCGPLRESDASGDAPAAARRDAERWLESASGGLWPGLSPGGTFDWDTLWSPDGARGPERLRSQYVRANTSPSDRYVQSLPGTLSSRPRADESGVDGLTLAGDWTRTGIDLGCIEAAALSGLQAARAITGNPPTSLPGEHDLFR